MVEYPSRERGPTTKRNIYLTPLVEIYTVSSRKLFGRRVRLDLENFAYN